MALTWLLPLASGKFEMMNRQRDALCLVNWWLVVPGFLVGFSFPLSGVYFDTRLVSGPVIFLAEWLCAKRLLSRIDPQIPVSFVRDYLRADYARRWFSLADKVEGISLAYTNSQNDLAEWRL